LCVGIRLANADVRRGHGQLRPCNDNRDGQGWPPQDAGLDQRRLLSEEARLACATSLDRGRRVRHQGIDQESVKRWRQAARRADREHGRGPVRLLHRHRGQPSKHASAPSARLERLACGNLMDRRWLALAIFALLTMLAPDASSTPEDVRFAKFVDITLDAYWK